MFDESNHSATEKFDSAIGNLSIDWKFLPNKNKTKTGQSPLKPFEIVMNPFEMSAGVALKLTSTL